MPKIKHLRKQKHLAAMELAELAKLDLNQPLMSAAESGKLLFTPDALERVCKALDCTPLDLFDSADEFDLMAVQRRMECAEPTDQETDVMIEYLLSRDRFASLPPANPEHKFRMADDDYAALMVTLKSYGYRTVGAYLRDSIYPKRKKA